MNFPLKSLTGNLKQLTGQHSQKIEFAFLAKTDPLMQVLAAMGINHTVMNPGWVTAHQHTHEGPSVHERDPLMWGIALFRFINCVIGNEGNLKYID